MWQKCIPSGKTALDMSMEQRRNAKAWGTEDPRGNPSNSGVDPAGNRIQFAPWWEASSLTTAPPQPHFLRQFPGVSEGTQITVIPGPVPGWCADFRLDSLLAFHQGQVTPGFLHEGIVADDAAGRRVFAGISRSPHPFIPAPLHFHLNHPHWCSAPPPQFLRRSPAGHAPRPGAEITTYRFAIRVGPGVAAERPIDATFSSEPRAMPATPRKKKVALRLVEDHVTDGQTDDWLMKRMVVATEIIMATEVCFETCALSKAKIKYKLCDAIYGKNPVNPRWRRLIRLNDEVLGVDEWIPPPVMSLSDAAGLRVFSGISRFSCPFIPALLHTRLASPSSVLETSLLRAVQIASHHFT
ncbi:hypothetical protein PR048_000072 [Dryococelus australis]|uniref:Uncharacterized protein n=1 Tax=Dryococelus australis TaxID=614101 RepID=A0ABQ9IDM9_9NEOP|nr:hypothetical protein PR048_000072 [Dryococelus australis]